MEGSDWERFVEDLQEPEVLFALEQAEALKAQSLVRNKECAACFATCSCSNLKSDARGVLLHRGFLSYLTLLSGLPLVWRPSASFFACILLVKGIRSSLDP